MTISRVLVRTEDAVGLMRKLGQHWSHRFPVDFDGEKSCTIQLQGATCDLFAHPDRLDIRLMIEADEDQERLEQAVEEQLRRFAVGEVLQFEWQRSDEQPGG